MQGIVKIIINSYIAKYLKIQNHSIPPRLCEHYKAWLDKGTYVYMRLELDDTVIYLFIFLHSRVYINDATEVCFVLLLTTAENTTTITAKLWTPLWSGSNTSIGNKV